jgi:hypothetical protein
MIHNLSGACYAVTLMVHMSNHNPLKSVYYAYLHSIIKYGIISWGNLSGSGNILTLQKKTEIWLLHNADPHVQAYLNN